jgi:hypothetical protein
LPIAAPIDIAAFLSLFFAIFRFSLRLHPEYRTTRTFRPRLFLSSRPSPTAIPAKKFFT